MSTGITVPVLFVILGGVLLLLVSILSLAFATPLLLAQAECIHTYRAPGCEGGSECVRREVVPCEEREPSLGDQLKGAAEEALDEFNEEEPERPQGAHLGVRG